MADKMGDKEIDDKWNTVYVSIKDATTPRDGGCMTDRWWAYMPGKGIMLVQPYLSGNFLAPQCNHSKAIVESVVRGMYPDADIVYLPVVYTGHEYQFGGKVYNG